MVITLATGRDYHEPTLGSKCTEGSLGNYRRSEPPLPRGLACLQKGSVTMSAQSTSGIGAFRRWLLRAPGLFVDDNYCRITCTRLGPTECEEVECGGSTGALCPFDRGRLSRLSRWLLLSILSGSVLKLLPHFTRIRIARPRLGLGFSDARSYRCHS